MISPSRDLDISSLQEAMTGQRLGQTIHYFKEVGSTNEVAVGLASEGKDEGTVVIAETQSRGRGRRGNAWESVAGLGLWFSLILKPDLPPEMAPLLSLWAATSMIHTFQALGCPAKVKWPNDIYCNGRKVAGLLSESSMSSRGISYVVLGIGINVLHTPRDFPPELRGTALSIQTAAGRPVHRQSLLLACLNQLNVDYERLLREGANFVLKRWRKNSLLLGKNIEVASSGNRVRGRVTRLDNSGALILEEPSGRCHEIFDGHVTHILEE